jgi:hypothetical protein
MQLLNEMSPEERASREREKPFCRRCGRAQRQRVEQRALTVIWNGDQPLLPSLFTNARMRVIEEMWSVPSALPSHGARWRRGCGLTSSTSGSLTRL